MPVNTEAQAQRRKDAWRSAITTTLVRLVLAALMIWLWQRDRSGLFRTMLLMGFAVYNVGTIVPVWILLKTRLKEIEGGEEDAAAQY